jgi:SpoU rRNA methylase family enzyme
MAIETSYRVSVPNNATVTVPLEAQTVNLKALTTMGKRIGAEKLVTTKAKAIATKAKALAKAAKKTLVAKHITDAAKALKYKIALVKNGAKISTSYQGVTGSMCVVATKGVAVVSNC